MAEEVATNEQTTLRDVVAAAYEEHIPTEVPDGEPAAVPAAAPAGETAVAAAEPKADERARGPDGKFVEKQKDATAAPGTATTPAKPTGAAETPVPAVAPALARPSSWKKELDAQWKALPADVQKYVLQREGEFAKGVSTYKQEWEQARPMMEALRPFQPHLQQAGITPDRWISNLGHAHLSLAQGTPEQKLSMFLKLAQDYQVPVHNLFAQGADGKVYFNPQVQPYAPQAQQARAQQPQAQDVERIIEQKFAQQAAVQSLAQFEQEAPQKYPHYETVKETMARLLEHGFAQDYPSAYQAAVRLPEHAAIFDAIQEQERAAKTEAEAKAKAEAAQRARRNTVSPRTATPAATAGKSGKKDLRSQLEEAFEEHAGAGRV